MPRLRPWALIVLLSGHRWTDQPSLLDLCRDRCGLRLHRPRRLAWNILFAPPRDRPGPIDRARIAATAASTATPAVVSSTAAEGTVRDFYFCREIRRTTVGLVNFEQPSAAQRCALLASAHGA